MQEPGGGYCVETEVLLMLLLQITQELREYAQQHQLDEADALKVTPAFLALFPNACVPPHDPNAPMVPLFL